VQACERERERERERESGQQDPLRVKDLCVQLQDKKRVMRERERERKRRTLLVLR